MLPLEQVLALAINQGESPHGDLTLGTGTKKVRSSGCYFCSYLMAGRSKLPVPEKRATPRRVDQIAGPGGTMIDKVVPPGTEIIVPDYPDIAVVMKELIGIGGFLGGGLNPGPVAEHFGLGAIDRREFSLTGLQKRLNAAPGVAVLGIDYKPGHSSGFSDADHFMFCFGVDSTGVHVVDPNGGKVKLFTPAEDGKGLLYAGTKARFSEMTTFKG